jgi:hypothetical protein
LAKGKGEREKMFTPLTFNMNPFSQPLPNNFGLADYILGYKSNMQRSSCSTLCWVCFLLNKTNYEERQKDSFLIFVGANLAMNLLQLGHNETVK